MNSIQPSKDSTFVLRPASPAQGGKGGQGLLKRQQFPGSKKINNTKHVLARTPDKEDKLAADKTHTHSNCELDRQSNATWLGTRERQFLLNAATSLFNVVLLIPLWPFARTLILRSTKYRNRSPRRSTTKIPRKCGSWWIWPEDHEHTSWSQVQGVSHSYRPGGRNRPVLGRQDEKHLTGLGVLQDLFSILFLIFPCVYM